MLVTDRYHHIIDGNNRLSIPSQVRNAMDPERDGVAFFAVREETYLQLIPEKLFEKLYNVRPVGLYVPPPVAEERRLTFGPASRLELDKQGRCIIPDHYMLDGKDSDPESEAFLGREITLVGVGDRLELWNRAEFKTHLRELSKRRAQVQQASTTLAAVPEKPATS